MFCKNCGGQMSDDSVNCPFCGAAVEQPVAQDASAQPAEAFTQPQEATEYVNFEAQAPQFESSEVEIAEQPKKKSFKALIIAAVLAVVALIVCVFAFSSKAQGVIMKLAPADTHYRFVIKNTADTFTDSFAEMYDNAVDFFGKAAKEEQKSANATIEGNVYVEVDGQIKEMIETAGIKEDKISVDYKIVQHEDAAAMELALSAGKEKLITLDFRMDKDLNLSLAIPELNEEAVRINLKDNEYFNMDEIQGDMQDVALPGVLGDLVGADSEEAEEIVKKIFDSVAKNAPDSKTTKKLVKKYVKIILEQITEVSRESEKLDIEGVVQSTTRFEIEITEELIFNMAKAVLEEAKEDKDIKELIEEYYDAAVAIAQSMDIDLEDQINVTASDLYTEFKDAIDEALDNLNDVDKDDLSSKALVKLTMWVNSDSEIIAIKVKVPSAKMEVFIGATEKGKEYAFEAYAKTESQKVFEITAKATKAKGLLSGDIKVKAMGQKYVTLSVKDFDCDAFEDDGYINGTFIVKPEEGLALVAGNMGDYDITKAKLELTVAMSEKAASADLSFKYDGDKLITIGAKTEIKDSEEVSLHSDYTENIEEWAAAMDPTALMEKLKGIVGEDVDLDDLLNGFGGMRGEASPDYYYDSKDSYTYYDGEFSYDF